MPTMERRLRVKLWQKSSTRKGYMWSCLVYAPVSCHKTSTQLSIESLCDNKEIIEANIRSVKISSPDVCVYPRFVETLLIGLCSTNPGTQIKPWRTTIHGFETTRNTMKHWMIRPGRSSRSLMYVLTNFLLMNFFHTHTPTLGRREDHSKCTSLSKCLVQSLKFPI